MSKGTETAVVDSGANFSVYSKKTAEYAQHNNSNIKLINKHSIHTVEYGNGSISTTKQQLNITPNFQAVVMNDKECPQNLLSVQSITDNNCTAIFKKDLCIIEPPEDSNLSTIMIKRDAETKLYHADLQEIHDLMCDMHEYQNATKVVDELYEYKYNVNSGVVKLPKTRTIKQKVIDLHERMDGSCLMYEYGSCGEL